MESVVFNSYVYYVDVIDYKLYLMRRNLEKPAEAERLGEAFYDNGIEMWEQLSRMMKKYIVR